MREILFKAKRKDNGKWVEGYYQKRYDLLGNEEHLIFHADSYTVWEYAEIDPETLCQFTGRCDRYGNKIWENDIVEAWSQGSRAIGTVKQRVDGLWIMSPAWKNHEFWELKPNSNGETTVEVLVNAFDNPELLQEVRQNEQS